MDLRAWFKVAIHHSCKLSTGDTQAQWKMFRFPSGRIHIANSPSDRGHLNILMGFFESELIDDRYGYLVKALKGSSSHYFLDVTSYINLIPQKWQKVLQIVVSKHRVHVVTNAVFVLTSVLRKTALTLPVTAKPLQFATFICWLGLGGFSLLLIS